MLDTDIEGLDPKDAAEYVLAFVTTLKKTEADAGQAAEDVAKWTRRVGLAVEKGEEELAGLARARLAEVEGRKASLETELADLRFKVGTLKDKLQRLRTRFRKSVDTDVLLAELEMLAGQEGRPRGHVQGRGGRCEGRGAEKEDGRRPARQRRRAARPGGA